MAEEEKVVESEAQTTQHNQSTFLNEMNSCGSCKTNLCGHDGKLLICLHTFCRSCIASVTDSSSKYSEIVSLFVALLNLDIKQVKMVA